MERRIRKLGTYLKIHQACFSTISFSQAYFPHSCLRRGAAGVQLLVGSWHLALDILLIPHFILQFIPSCAHKVTHKQFKAVIFTVFTTPTTNQIPPWSIFLYLHTQALSLLLKKDTKCIYSLKEPIRMHESHMLTLRLDGQRWSKKSKQ